jgi:hypothetical protein
MKQETAFPDISDILARKERGRRALAKLTFREKLDMLDRLRAAAAMLKAARRVPPVQHSGPSKPEPAT